MKIADSSSRKSAIIVGVLFIVGDIAGVLSLLIAGPILGNSDYLIRVSASGNQIIIGALLVLTMGFALAMIPVVMYSILKRHSKVLALGYLVFRGALETVTYIALAISWLLLLTVSREYVSAGVSSASYFQALGTLLQKAADWDNQIVSIVFSLGALMLYFALYQSKLIPRWLSIWGLAGAILYFAAPLSSMFGSGQELLMAPLGVQEIVFAMWLIVKGFNSSAATGEPDGPFDGEIRETIQREVVSRS